MNKALKIVEMCRALLKYGYYSVLCKMKSIDNSKVWLIAERGTDARDNGYHFYRYMKSRHPEIKVRYVISKDSPDYQRISARDVVEFGSREHYILFKTAGALISTHVMGYSPDKSLFYRMDKKGRLKLAGKKIFLRHGIVYSKIQSQKNEVKADLIITTTEKEFEYVKESYGYGDDVVKCTGLARYDSLIDDSDSKSKKILIMPTFRKWLTYEKNFTDSKYFLEWNGLLNDSGFLKYIEDNEIEVLFYPHFRVQQHLQDFKPGSKRIKLCSTKEYDVQKLLKESNILITDYSSVQFDFAYMDKAIIYFQFDEKEFYSKHYSKGYFDFKTMGFGPVCKTKEEVVEALKNNQNKSFYQERASSFFKYRDYNNSERIFEEIWKKMNPRIKVMQVLNGLNIGGLETCVMNICRYADQSKFDFLFVTNKPGKYDYQDEIEARGWKLIRINPIEKGRIKNLTRLNKVIKSERPDVVHCHMNFGAARVMSVAKRNHVKTRITHSHTVKKYGLLKTAIHRVMAFIIRKNANVMIACSEAAGMALFKKPEFIVVNNGIDLKKYTFDKTKRDVLRRELGINKNDVAIGHVGRFVEVKNHDFIVRIAKQLSVEHPEVKLVLIGDGPLKKEIQAKCRQKPLKESVIIMGNKVDATDYYNAFDVLVFPSIFEGIPLTLIEAQANGLPIIASSNINPGIKVNSNVRFASLDEGPSIWAQMIVDSSIKRVEPSKKMLNYSVEHTVNEISNIYERGHK